MTRLKEHFNIVKENWNKIFKNNIHHFTLEKFGSFLVKVKYLIISQISYNEGYADHL